MIRRQEAELGYKLVRKNIFSSSCNQNETRVVIAYVNINY